MLDEEGNVGGGDIKTIDGDDFCGVGEGHSFCHSDSDSQSCEAARADRDIDVLDLVGLSAEAVEQVTDGREKLGTVSARAGKFSFGE
jgi:hypothetical protein